MGRDKINIGDIVSISFHGSKMTLSPKAKVLYIPCNPGDGWMLEDVESGDIHEISEGCTITKRKEA